MNLEKPNFSEGQIYKIKEEIPHYVSKTQCD